MLKFIMPVILLIAHSSTYLNWWQSFISLLIILICTMLFIPFSSTTSLSSNFMLDNMSSSLIILSLMITAMMLLASYKVIQYNNAPKTFIFACLFLLYILMMAFSMSSLIYFYVWFEASLIPTMYLILYWGYQPERLQASMYLMLYTITASLPMFMVFMNVWTSSLSSNMAMSVLILHVPETLTSWSISSMYWMLLVMGMLVKLPMFMTHLWLPKAHVEAPIAGSMVLAAVLLKLGGYGLIRILLNLQSPDFPSEMLISVSIWGAILTGLICVRQPDMKSMIAYSSVGHMGLLIAGAMSMTTWGISGALMMMIAHGLCSSALFILANTSYMMTHTRSSFLTKGMLMISPSLSMWWFLTLSINMAAPPTLNLVSEIYLLTSIIYYSWWTMIPLAGISFITAVYSLNLFSQTQHGALSNISNSMPSYKPIDMTLISFHLIPIIFITFKPELLIL